MLGDLGLHGASSIDIGRADDGVQVTKVAKEGADHVGEEWGKGVAMRAWD